MIKLRDFDQLLFEVEERMRDLAHNCIVEIDALLHKYNLPEETIDYIQFKSKWTRLRIYWCLPKLSDMSLDDDCDEDEYHKYLKLESEIINVVDKYESIKFGS